MRRIFLSFALLFTGLVLLPPAEAVDSCAMLNSGAIADNGLTVTMKSIEMTEKAGSNVLTISYNQLNTTADKKIDEGSFKLFFADGSSEPQYGGFGYFFPTDTRDRTYSWEFLKNKEPLVIEYNAGFFSAKYDTTKLNWVLPGKPCNLTPTVPEVNWDGKQRFTSELDWKLCSGGAKIAGTKDNCGIEPDVQAAKDKELAASKVQAQKVLPSKGITITCARGSVVKTVTSLKPKVLPKCPSGFKRLS